MHDLLRAYAAGLAAAQDNDQARQAALTGLFDYYLAASAAAVSPLHRGPAAAHDLLKTGALIPRAVSQPRAEMIPRTHLHMSITAALPAVPEADHTSLALPPKMAGKLAGSPKSGLEINGCSARIGLTYLYYFSRYS